MSTKKKKDEPPFKPQRAYKPQTMRKEHPTVPDVPVAPHPDLAAIKELLEEQYDHARKMAAADAKGTSMFFLARGDYVGMFVVRNGEAVSERLYLCKIVEVIDNPIKAGD